MYSSLASCLAPQLTESHLSACMCRMSLHGGDSVYEILSRDVYSALPMSYLHVLVTSGETAQVLA